MKYSAVIVAAGEGTRMGLGYNKVYYHRGEQTILEKTMRIFLTDPEWKDCPPLEYKTKSQVPFQP